MKFAPPDRRKIVSYSLDQETIKYLTDLSKEHGATRSQVAEYIVIDWRRSNKRAIKKILESLRRYDYDKSKVEVLRKAASFSFNGKTVQYINDLSEPRNFVKSHVLESIILDWKSEHDKKNP